MKTFTFFLFVMLAIVLAGCAPKVKWVGTPVDNEVGATLLQQWRGRVSRVSTMQGIAKIQVETAEGSMNGGTQVLLAEKPDRLRAETLSLFGTPLLTLTANGEALSVFTPTENRFYTGSATPTNLGRFVRIPLRLNDLVSILLHQPPLIRADSEQVFALNEEQGWLLVRRSGQRRQELRFDAQRNLRQLSYFDDEALFLDIGYGEFTADGNDFPQHFTIEIPELETFASLEFSELTINRQFLSTIFTLTPPAGVDVFDLDRALPGPSDPER
ncbi:MAG: DUF4292 domain-containing protein [Desulfuromonadales bacterium]|nr:DUF4292 domain-containing protein [Desulfuromonadales bacterium]